MEEVLETSFQTKQVGEGEGGCACLPRGGVVERAWCRKNSARARRPPALPARRVGWRRIDMEFYTGAQQTGGVTARVCPPLRLRCVPPLLPAGRGRLPPQVRRALQARRERPQRRRPAARLQPVRRQGQRRDGARGARRAAPRRLSRPRRPGASRAALGACARAPGRESARRRQRRRSAVAVCRGARTRTEPPQTRAAAVAWGGSHAAGIGCGAACYGIARPRRRR